MLSNTRVYKVYGGLRDKILEMREEEFRRVQIWTLRNSFFSTPKFWSWLCKLEKSGRDNEWNFGESGREKSEIGHLRNFGAEKQFRRSPDVSGEKFWKLSENFSEVRTRQRATLQNFGSPDAPNSGCILKPPAVKFEPTLKFDPTLKSDKFACTFQAA